MTQGLNRPLVGITWMLISGICFVGMTALVRFIGTDVNAVQGGFIRYAWSVLFLLPSLWTLKGLSMSGSLWGWVGARGAVQALGIALWYYGIARLPVAEVTAIGYLNPVLVTIGGAVFFGERLALRRILAVLVAVIGALIILRPGMRELQLAHLSQIATAFCLAGSYLVAKRLTAELSPSVIVALMSLTTTLCMAPFALYMWEPVTLEQIMIFGGVAAFGTAGHYAMMRGFAAAPIAVTQPVTFLQLLWATLLGALAFNEGIDPFVLLGGGVIIGAISYIAWREQQVKKAGSA